MFDTPESFWYEFVFLFLGIGAAQAALQVRFLTRLFGRRCTAACFAGYLLLLYGVAALELSVPMSRLAQSMLETIATGGYVSLKLRQSPAQAALAAVLTQTVWQLSNMFCAAGLDFAAPLLVGSQRAAIGAGMVSAALALLISYAGFRALARYWRMEAVETKYLPVVLPAFFLLLFLWGKIIDLEFTCVTLDAAGRVPTAFGSGQILLLSVVAAATMASVLYAYQKLTAYHAQQARRLLLEKERDWQKAYVEEAGQRDAKTRAFRHDIRNHLLVLRGLLTARRVEEADAYLAQIETAAAALSAPASTGNAALDALLGSKFEAARQEGVEIACELHLPAQLAADDYDLCIIFANALDNARKACAYARRKQIRLTSRKQGDFLLLAIENSCDPEGAFAEGSGMGLANIRAVAEKYGGAVQIERKADRFALRVLLCLQDTAVSYKEKE